MDLCQKKENFKPCVVFAAFAMHAHDLTLLSGSLLLLLFVTPEINALLK